MGLRRMQIDGLTPYQVELCDLIYQCDTREELDYLLEVLDPSDRRTAMTLIRMMHLEYIEEELMEPLIRKNRYPQAEQLMKNLMKRGEDNNDTTKSDKG